MEPDDGEEARREQDEPDALVLEVIGQTRQLELGVLEPTGREVVGEHRPADVEADRQVAGLGLDHLRLGVGAGAERREQRRQESSSEQELSGEPAAAYTPRDALLDARAIS